MVQGPAVVSGQHILQLVAAGANGRHALAARFHAPTPAGSVLSDASLREILTHFVEPGGIYRAVAWVKARFFGNPNPIYRAVAWVKAEPGARIMIEARNVRPANGKSVKLPVLPIFCFVQSSIPPEKYSPAEWRRLRMTG